MVELDQAHFGMNLRRLRRTQGIRDLIAETRLRPEMMMQPQFVVEGIKQPEPLTNIHPNVARHTPDSLLASVEANLERGCRSLLLFGVPTEKSESQFDPTFIANQIQAIKKQFGNAITLAVDLCLCSYTESGACGIWDPKEGVKNHPTVQILCDFAKAYAQAGADIIAPSDMMDGRIGAMRDVLNAEGHDQTLLMSYSAKFHSTFYGPFRQAADSRPKGPKDRADYQIDPRNTQDALRSSLRDADEGADILMVKPGLPYLDVLQTLSKSIDLPCAVYQVSGESVALEALAEGSDERRRELYLETWTSFARAGARMIITYAASDATAWLR